MAYCPHCGHQVGEELPRSRDASIRLVTVLFGDVSGFTALAERLPPEDVASTMNACFESISEPIVRYGGTIDKYIGDAIMARFGAPHAHEDDPVRAVHAALEMQVALVNAGPRLQVSGAIPLSMRIGINTGQALAGEVGSAALKQFTLMGDTVNLASRLEQRAEAGTILVGESTYQLAKHVFEFRALPPMEIRGQSKLINAFMPVGTRASGPTPVAADRRVNLIGREAELAELDRYLDETRAKQGRIVALVGEPGVGKTRLSEEFWSRHRSERLVRLSSSAPSFGESMPYSLLAAFVRALVAGDDGQKITPDRLRDRLLPLLPQQSIGGAVALLGDVLGLPAAASEVSQLEAGARQAMLANVLEILLEARSHQTTLLLCLEDLHWIDAASLEVFDRLFAGITRMHVMVLLTFRPEFSHGWAGTTGYRQIDVQELSSAHALELLAQHVDAADIPPAVGKLVMEKAGGNPFFLEQIVSNLVESGALRERHGAWTAHDIQTISVPNSIQEILLARLDQVPQNPRRVLEVAAVLGHAFSHSLLKRVIDAGNDCEEHLWYLCRHGFLVERRSVSGLEYTFKHSLTRDVVYTGLLTQRRQMLHERVAEALETADGEASGDRLSLLAVHYEKTSNRLKALQYALAAGEHWRKLSANEDARRHFQRALDWLDDDDSRPRRAYVLEVIGDLSELMARFEEASDHYTRALGEYTATTDVARVLRKRGDVAASCGRYPEALTQYRRAEEVLDTTDDPDALVSIWLSRARVERSRGARQVAADMCMKALVLAPRVLEDMRASLYMELGEIEREQGHLRTAFGYLEAAAAVWEKKGALDKQALVTCSLADVPFHAGDLPRAQEILRTALDIYRRMLDPQGIGSTLAAMGRTRLAMGELQHAVECSSEALAIADEIDDRLLATMCLLQLGAAYVELGELERARDCIDQAFTRSKKIRNWRGAAQALVVRARLLRVQGHLDLARAALRRAAGLADEMMDPWLQFDIDMEQAQLEEINGSMREAERRGVAAVAAARDLSDPRLAAIAERIVGRTRARTDHWKVALELLANSTAVLRQAGALLESARSARDFVAIAGEGEPESAAMLEFARMTFERVGSTRDLDMMRDGDHRPTAQSKE
ncbi:MAG: adenylate/guanylate cyclase domain-containing protein [Chloroflexota bacterium]